MDHARVVRVRRMVRAFTTEPIGLEAVDALIDLARRAPSAGNSQGVNWVVLTGPHEVGRYWDVTLPPGPDRERFRWQGLLRAPVLVLPVIDPDRYLERYTEPDKSHTGLGAGVVAWPVPYWWVDGGMVVQNLLLGVVEAGLGACFFGLFQHETAVCERFGIPAGRRILGAVAIGHPDPEADGVGRSSERRRPPLRDVVHHGEW